MFSRFKGTSLLLGLWAAVCGSCSRPSDTDSVVIAKSANDARFGETESRKKAAHFLVEMADARMMDGFEGQVAVDRGVSPDVKAYGARMITEQAELHKEIKQVAMAMGVQLPGTISDAKADGLKDLREQSGDDADKKFISMITIDHKRDVKEFKKAMELNEPLVRDFAARRLPTIEQHLAAIEAIHDARK